MDKGDSSVNELILMFDFNGNRDDLRGDVLVYGKLDSGYSLGIIASVDRDRLSELTGKNLGSLEGMARDGDVCAFFAEVEGVSSFLERDDIDVVNCGSFFRRSWMVEVLQRVSASYFAIFTDQKRRACATYRGFHPLQRREILMERYVVPLFKAYEAEDDEEVCILEAGLEEFCGDSLGKYCNDLVGIFDLLSGDHDKLKVKKLVDLHVDLLLELMNEGYERARELSAQIQAFQ